MKSVRSYWATREEAYRGKKKPKYAIGEYLKVYSGRYEGHCFVIKDIRYNYDVEAFQYLYDTGILGGWYEEGSVIPASSKQGWHYDSQGYCDNPGRGY